MKEEIEQARTAFSENRLTESRELVDRIISEKPHDVDALLLRSQLFHKQQEWGSAINDLNRVLEIDPDNRIAKNYKDMALKIIRFWHKDNYNP